MLVAVDDSAELDDELRAPVDDDVEEVAVDGPGPDERDALDEREVTEEELGAEDELWALEDEVPEELCGASLAMMNAAPPMIAIIATAEIMTYVFFNRGCGSVNTI